ncbi:MAG: hypothetical protein HYX41_01100 [Bdellovibrio sp.]|nr:hypothetical protein [Bdellovibrio sp.]
MNWKVATFAFFLIVFPYVSDGAILIGHTTGKGDFETLPPGDKRFGLAYKIVFENRWPSPSSQLSMLEKGQKPDHLHEEDFLKQLLVRTCRDRQLDCHDLELKWIPPTLWDLSLVAANPKLNPFAPQKLSCGLENKLELVEGKLEDSEQSESYFSCLQNLVWIEINKHSERKLHFNSEDFVRVAKATLLSLVGVTEPKDKNRIFTWERFKLEIGRAHENRPNLFEDVIHLESQAHEVNKAILWRVTNGLKIFDLSKVKQPVDSKVPDYAFEGFLEKEGVALRQQKKNDCDLALLYDKLLASSEVLSPVRDITLQPLEIPAVTVLDLPLLLPGEPSGVFKLKDLSFSHSILAGYFFDHGASTYTLLRGFPRPKIASHDILYGIMVDREFLSSDSKFKGFSVGSLPDWFGVYGIGETFHVRMGYLNPEDAPSTFGSSFYRKTPPKQSQIIARGMLIAELLASKDTLVLDLQTTPGHENREGVYRLAEAHGSLNKFLSEYLNCKKKHFPNSLND